MHVLVPVERRHTYEQTREFAEIVAGTLARTHRGLVTTEWTKAKRRGVLIDANQNGEGKTIASVYSVRPRPGAPVSTPLRWEEVDEGLDPLAFTMDAVLARIDRDGDLFEGVLSTRQRLGSGSRVDPVKLAELVAELDAYFRVPDVRDDDWSKSFDLVYPEPYWREYVVPGWEGHWNGLSVRGAEEVERAVTCVFPSDRIVRDACARHVPVRRASARLRRRAGVSAALARDLRGDARERDQLLQRSRAAGHAPRGLARRGCAPRGPGWRRSRSTSPSARGSRAEPRSSARAG